MVMGECGKERKEIKYILRLPGDLTWRTSRSHNGINARTHFNVEIVRGE